MASTRKFLWFPVSQLVLQAAAGAETLSANLLLGSGASGAGAAGNTITRIVGRIYYKAATVNTLSMVIAALGIFNDVVTATTTPAPSSEPSPWMWWKPIVDQGTRREVSAGVFSDVWEYVEFDIKAQRLLRANEGLFLKYEEIDGVAMDTKFGLRILIKLP